MSRRNAPAGLALLGILTAGLLLAASPGAAAEAKGLSVAERNVQGETVFVVRNPFYEVTIRPQAGASVSSLKFGLPERTTLTRWTPNVFSGLLQEVRTADSSFRLVRNEKQEGRAVLEFETRCDLFVLRKAFEFSRDLPTFKVTLTCENHLDYSLAGVETPAFSSLVLPAGGKPTGREYYCLSRGKGARAVTAATVLREFSPLRPDDGALHWLAVTDPVSRRGLGFAFLDAAAVSPSAVRNGEGMVTVRWRFPRVPSGSSLRTEVLVVPLQGFAAVSELGRDFAADAVSGRNPEGRQTVSLRLTPLKGALANVSVITRAYGRDGGEAGVWDSLHYETIDSSETVTGGLTAPEGAPEAAWLQHEIYSQGKRVGRFLVQLQADVPLPAGGARKLPAPTARPLVQPGEGKGPPVDDETRRRGFVAWRFEGDTVTRPFGPMQVSLLRGERDTVMFGVQAIARVERLRAGFAAGGEHVPEGLKPLPPAAGYVWCIEQAAKGGARLVPFAERALNEGDALWLAVTLDASQLEPGAYHARLVLQSNGEPVELPVAVRVADRRLAPRDGFALWFVDAETCDSKGVQTLSRLRAHTVSAVTMPAEPRATDESLAAALRSVEAARLDMLSFHACGAGVDAAERMARAGMPCSAVLPSPVPGWLSVVESDNADDRSQLQRLGFETAAVFPGIASPETDARWREGLPRYWLVEGGCAPERVHTLLRLARMRFDDSVWLYLDVRGMDWRRAAMETRRAFWAAAWQGMAGAAVRCERPSEEVDSQSLLWHILRDAREEAALVGLASGSARRPSKHAGEFGAVISQGEDSDILVRPERRAFRTVSRAGPRGKADGAPLAAFRGGKAKLLALLDKMEAGKPTPPSLNNLWWGRSSLTKAERGGWAIFAAGGEEAKARAARFRAAIKKRTQRDVPLLTELLQQEGEGAKVEAAPPGLIWIVTDAAPPDDLPENVRKAAAAAGEKGLRLLRLGEATSAVVLGPGVDIEALVKSFRTERFLYRHAKSVR